MKFTLVLVAIVFLIASFSQTALAADESVSIEDSILEEQINDADNGGEVETDSIGPCPIYGTHQMHLKTSNGAVLRSYPSGNVLLYNPCVYECNCGEMVVTSGKPHLAGWDVGYYCVTTWYATYDGYYSYLTRQTSLPYASYLDGFDFST